MNYLKVFSVAICFALTACGSGGGGGDSTDTQSDPVQTDTNAVAEGFWVGTYSTEAGLMFPAFALVASSGDVGIDLGNGVVFTGSRNVVNTQITMAGGENIAPASPVALEGTLNSKSSLELAVTLGGYAMGSGDLVSFSYDPVYERSSSFKTVEGEWSGFNSFMLGGSGSSGDWILTIAADGTLSGDFIGLPINGDISLIDSSKNEYSVNLSIDGPQNGSYNGNYSGIGTVVDIDSESDYLIMFLERSLPYPIRGRLILMKN